MAGLSGVVPYLIKLAIDDELSLSDLFRVFAYIHIFDVVSG